MNFIHKLLAAFGPSRALVGDSGRQDLRFANGFDTDTGDKVRFHGSNIFLPGAAGWSAVLSEEPELEGTIIGFSDSGSKTRYFAVIEVVKRHSLIVPVEKLELVKAASRKTDS